MKLQKILLGLLVLSQLALPTLITGVKPVYAADEQLMTIEAKPVDKRVLILKDYLAKHNSPLENNAQDFIDAADQYELDWRLVASIAGTESTFGKAIPGGHDPLYTSYNGWGWGVYGDNVLKFKSWREAIFTISKGLKENYVDKGYTEPFSMNKKYASSKTWGTHVNFFMNDIEKYAANYPFDVELAELELVNTELTSDLPETRNLKATLANVNHTFRIDILN